MNRLKRLYEAGDIQQMPAQPNMPRMAPPAPVQMQQGMDMPMEAPQPVATSMEEMPTFSEVQPEQQALPEPDVMNLTVRELVERCQKINPLVCMGLEQFIEMNKDEILAMTTGAEEEPMTGDSDDLTFSKQVEPQPAEFSLDQPETDLNFPA
jgi:hypothetical protein